MERYKIPEEYYFRIHHVRPRFKNDIESVLISVAGAISKLGECQAKEFAAKLDEAIRMYPGNAHRELKTIKNWRTEISALFGFIEHRGKIDKPGRRALELAQNEDLLECFKVFLYNFQYPGAHIKPQSVLEQIENGVHFKPAQYILSLLKYANKDGGKSLGITKFEACHCVFNDLRVTRDNEGAEKTWARIVENRRNQVSYDQTGDVVRYAGDIIDYMEMANLLKTYDGRTYYLNTLEEEAIVKFTNSTEWFSGYDAMIKSQRGTLEAVNGCIEGWFEYVNRDMGDTDFSTDVFAYTAADEKALEKLKATAKGEASTAEYFKEAHSSVVSRLDVPEQTKFSTKDIGDMGECLVLGHECMRVKLGGREDLIHLIKPIPTACALGYDIKSVELDDIMRYIEVKTTVSSKTLLFNRVRLTRNEWVAAKTNREHYYVYRLLLSKKEKRLFLLQDPVGLYKNNMVKMIPSDGVEITFDPKKVGEFVELLTWES